MDSGPRDAAHPPRLLRLLVRLLIRGRDASFIVRDLDDSFARDVERGLDRGRALRRYVWNALASAWSVWAMGLRRLVMHGIGLDAKLGLRMLAKQPLITAVAVLTLGLGIPASLTLVHGGNVLFGELPGPDGHRVVGIRHFDLNDSEPLLSSVHDYERWMELTSLQSIGAVRSYSVNVNAEGAGAPPVSGAQITASSFDVLRARPLLGRVLDVADERVGAPDVVLLGEDLWSARFARDPGVVGRTVSIGRTPHTVVGVMPADFRFPLSHQLWMPFRARAVDFPPGAGRDPGLAHPGRDQPHGRRLPLRPGGEPGDVRHLQGGPLHQEQRREERGGDAGTLHGRVADSGRARFSGLRPGFSCTERRRAEAYAGLPGLSPDSATWPERAPTRCSLPDAAEALKSVGVYPISPGPFEVPPPRQIGAPAATGLYDRMLSRTWALD